MAEIRQDGATLRKEVKALEININWRFTTEDARIKLKISAWIKTSQFTTV